MPASTAMSSVATEINCPNGDNQSDLVQSPRTPALDPCILLGLRFFSADEGIKWRRCCWTGRWPSRVRLVLVTGERLRQLLSAHCPLPSELMALPVAGDVPLNAVAAGSDDRSCSQPMR